MGKTLRQLDDELGADELVTWEAFEGLYTLPDAYFITGQICTAVGRFFAGADVGPGHFVPMFAPPPREQTPAEQRAILRDRLAAVRGAQGQRIPT